MPLDDRVIHLSPPDPDRRFGQIGNTAAFDLPAHFLCVSHVIPPLPDDNVDLRSLLIGGQVAAVDLIESFQKSVLDNVTFQALDVRLATPGHFAVQSSGCRAYNLGWILANQRLHGDV
jgi:hypothetical protein